MAEKVGELYVEFVAKGAAALNAVMGELDKIGGALGETISGSMGVVESAINTVTGAFSLLGVAAEVIAGLLGLVDVAQLSTGASAIVAAAGEIALGVAALFAEGPVALLAATIDFLLAPVVLIAIALGVLFAAVIAVVGPIVLLVGALAALAGVGVMTSAEGARITEVFDRMSRVVGGVLAPVLDAFADFLNAVMGPLETFARLIGDTVGMAMGVFKSVMQSVFAVVMPFINLFLTLAQSVMPLVNELGRLVDVFLEITEVLAELVGSLLVEMADIITAVVIPAVKALAFFVRAVADALHLLGFRTRSLATTGGAGRDLTPKNAAGFEDVTAIYKRVQMAALKADTSGTTDSQWLEKIAGSTEKTSKDPDWFKTIGEFFDKVTEFFDWMKGRWPFGK